MAPAIQLKLREASAILGVNPKDLQNLVQFGVLQPERRDRFFVFDATSLLEARVAFYLKESLGTSVPLLARFIREIFAEAQKSKSGRFSDVSISSRPVSGKEVVRIEVPLRALATDLEARLPKPKDSRNEADGRGRKGWKGISEKDILKEIKSYRAQRRKTPEISVVALSQKKTS